MAFCVLFWRVASFDSLYVAHFAAVIPNSHFPSFHKIVSTTNVAISASTSLCRSSPSMNSLSFPLVFRSWSKFADCKIKFSSKRLSAPTVWSRVASSVSRWIRSFRKAFPKRPPLSSGYWSVRVPLMMGYSLRHNLFLVRHRSGNNSHGSK